MRDDYREAFEQSGDENVRRIINIEPENRELHDIIDLYRQPELNSPYLYWPEGSE